MELTKQVNMKRLQQDDIFPENKIVNLNSLTQIPFRKGLEKAVISGGTIVNIVSDSYGHLPNESFFAEAERKMIDADLNYQIRSINRDNRSFAADYILSDGEYSVNVKNGLDKIKPMLRFTNSYDGSCKTSGHFGFFREVCSNGLHVAHSIVGFSVKHKGDIAQVVLPEIRTLVRKFIDNEFYTIVRKFETLAEKKIDNVEDFVKVTANHFKLFKYECSETNHSPSLNARLVAETIYRESNLLGISPNFWIGYNAFNELIHEKLKKPFEQQKKVDAAIFEHLVEIAN